MYLQGWLRLAWTCSYAWEISTVEGGWGLHDVLASRKPTLDGIVNGIDLVEWDPATDKHTPAKFSAEDLSGGLVREEQPLKLLPALFCGEWSWAAHSPELQTCTVAPHALSVSKPHAGTG